MFTMIDDGTHKFESKSMVVVSFVCILFDED